MFVTNWISTTKIQKISEITNFFRHYFLSRTEVDYRSFFMVGIANPQVLSVEHFSIADCKSARTPDGKHKPKCFFYLNATNATHRLSI